MSYCLNPSCSHSQNSGDINYCLSCGNTLLLQARYRALKLIDRGRMGKTFLAVDELYPTKPCCVIKQFFPQDRDIDNQRKAANLFQREVQQLVLLGKHRQIPELLDYFEQDGQQYLVQEFIPGQNLEQELAETGAFNETKIRQLLNDLLPVLQFIHDHQIIHRDIKPANIIRRHCDDQLVLVDFGVAKYATEAALAQTGTLIGSAEYIAPEQIRGKAVFASDLYSLGISCIHLLTQIPPFDIFDSSEDAWVWRCYLGHPVSQSLGQILDKLLQNAIKHRYQSAAEALADLNYEPTQVANKSAPTDEIDRRARLERSPDPTFVKPDNSPSSVAPEFSVTIFDPQTQSWHRLSHVCEGPESVGTVVPSLCTQASQSSATDREESLVSSTVSASKPKKSFWAFLETIWLSTIGLSMFTCIAIGLRVKQPSPSPEVKNSSWSLEEVQPRRSALDLGCSTK